MDDHKVEPKITDARRILLKNRPIRRSVIAPAEKSAFRRSLPLAARFMEYHQDIDFDKSSDPLDLTLVTTRELETRSAETRGAESSAPVQDWSRFNMDRNRFNIETKRPDLVHASSECFDLSQVTPCDLVPRSAVSKPPGLDWSKYHSEPELPKPVHVTPSPGEQIPRSSRYHAAKFNFDEDSNPATPTQSHFEPFSPVTTEKFQCEVEDPFSDQPTQVESKWRMDAILSALYICCPCIAPRQKPKAAEAKVVSPSSSQDSMSPPSQRPSRQSLPNYSRPSDDFSLGPRNSSIRRQEVLSAPVSLMPSVEKHYG